MSRLLTFGPKSDDPRQGAAEEHATTATEPDISVRGVSHAFGSPGDHRHVLALRETSIDVKPGEFFCLIGPSGCGKSTLLSLIGGMIEPQVGEVLVRGRPMRGPRPHDVAFVFQESTLFPWRTVLDNVKVGLQFQGVRNEREREERAWTALGYVNLADFADHYPDQLSGGMKQRVALARALSLDTDILLMDEPFAALDEQTRMVLGEELSVLLWKAKKTIVFVTHSLSEAAFLADRVAVFSARPGHIKAAIAVGEDHPRKPAFMTSARCNELRNELYELLREEIMATVSQSRAARSATPSTLTPA
jgi:NitT/TauT family transport system ATP-binding protein